MAISNLNSFSFNNGGISGLSTLASGWSSLGYYSVPSPKIGTYILMSTDTNNCRAVAEYGGAGNVYNTNFLSFMAVGYTTTPSATTLYTAPTGLTIYGPWVKPTTPTGFYSLGYLNGTYFFGALNAIYSSTDLVTYTLRYTHGTAAYFRGFAYGNGVYSAVGYNGTNYVNVTSTDGITWTNRSGSSPFMDLVFGNGKFVSVYNNQYMIYSTDGYTWSFPSSGTVGAITSVAHNGTTGAGSLFVGVGASGSITTSVDGVTWTSRSSGTSSAFYSVAYGNGLWVAVGTASQIFTSSDGITWTRRSDTNLTGGASADFVQVAYGNGRWITSTSGYPMSTSSAYGGIYTSTDGITWRPAGGYGNGVTVSNYRSVIYAGGKFLAATNGNFFTSVDGLQGAPQAFTLYSSAAGVIN